MVSLNILRHFSDMTLGERIKQKREEKGLTKVDLAKLAKINHIQLAKYESDKSHPTSGVLERLANVLDTTTDFIIKGVPPIRSTFSLERFNSSLERAKSLPYSDMVKLYDILELFFYKLDVDDKLKSLISKGNNDDPI